MSINAFAVSTQQLKEKKPQINNQQAHVLKSTKYNFLKKPSINLPGFMTAMNPSCVQNCSSEFNACLDAGYPWNSCNWEFQACADICFPNPIDC